MPKNRAVYFTRGQSIRRLFFAVALIIWYLLDHDKTAPQDWAIIAVLVGGIISFIPNIRDPDDEKSLLSRSARALSGLMLLLAVVMKLGSELSKPGFWAFLQRVQQHLQPYKGTTLTLGGTGLSLALSFLFFSLKRKQLLIYARIELIFALVSCYLAVGRLQHDLAPGSISVLVASIYLTVRGLDNRQRALDESGQQGRLRILSDL